MSKLGKATALVSNCDEKTIWIGVHQPWPFAQVPRPSPLPTASLRAVRTGPGSHPQARGLRDSRDAYESAHAGRTSRSTQLTKPCDAVASGRAAASRGAWTESLAARSMRSSAAPVRDRIGRPRGLSGGGRDAVAVRTGLVPR